MIIVNQHVSIMCIGVERNQGNQKKKKKLLEDNIIKNVRNLFKLKKNAAIKDRKKKFITNQ